MIGEYNIKVDIRHVRAEEVNVTEMCQGGVERSLRSL
jgi:hypothetical protein